jgi:enoyl-CoA hydratase/carnithine racemase
VTLEATRCTVSEHGICRVEINNPPLNLLTQTVRRELGDIFARVDHENAVRVVIFGSARQPFCAGADLKEFPLCFDPSVARAPDDSLPSRRFESL